MTRRRERSLQKAPVGTTVVYQDKRDPKITRVRVIGRGYATIGNYRTGLWITLVNKKGFARNSLDRREREKWLPASAPQLDAVTEAIAMIEASPMVFGLVKPQRRVRIK